MCRCVVTVSLALLLMATKTPGEEVSATKGELLFALHVRPLLTSKCFACHGEDKDKIEGELDLTTRSGMLKGGETSDEVLVPEKAVKSLLYSATTWKDPDLQMPPKENDRLTEQQTWHIRDWINEGAPWPSDEKIAAIVKRHAEGVIVKTSGGLSDDWNNRRYKKENLWAYQPVEKPAVPSVKGTDSTNAIDAFVKTRLQGLYLQPAPPADRGTLIRRVTYDLIGLPPTPEEVEDFIGDPASDEDALQKVVDRLLASPHYGEHWARHWLDVVRYADSSGFANDYERGNAWRYRDYVIRSFNNDKPYDQFVREQIAGDEIDPDGPEMLIAVGFLRMGPWELTGMEVAKVARQRFLDDVTNSVGQVLLSHTLRCAKCHDHKFDPIPTRDYYSFQAIFATTQLVERRAEFLPKENRDGFEERKYLQQRGAYYSQLLGDVNRKRTIKAARDWLAAEDRDATPFESTLKELRDAKKPDNLDAVRRAMQQKGTAPDLIPPRHVGFAPQDFGIERIARKGQQRLKWEFERYEPIAFSVYSGRTRNLKNVSAPLRMPEDRLKNGELEQGAILAGGDPFSPTIEVAPGVLSVVGSFNRKPPARAEEESAGAHAFGLRLNDGIEGRRKALADWIASPTNPLTTRSIVNRVWHWHFGQGIAGNPNNFGATGKKPTHPELLDWLAATFVEEGWSLKKLHRRILMSKTYRCSAEHPDREALAKQDPNGTSYAAFHPRRLTAEELRDSMLAVSAEWNPRIGGIPARPEMNLEAALQPRMVMGTFAAAWQPCPLPEQRHRRSIYALKIRGQRDPFMEVFNEPSPENSCEVRDASTGTPQVFSMFNSQFTYDRALVFAARLKRETNSREAAIDAAFQLAFGRSPSDAESQATLAHWTAMTARHEKLKFDKANYPREVIREAVEENTGEKFSFTEPLHVYNDFVPDLKPADADAATRGLAEVCLVLLNSNEFVYVY
jgi:mono/diheme cytochrome c family protein